MTVCTVNKVVLLLECQEKSSLDWNKYKEEEGLEEELAQHSKDGSVAII